MEWSEHNGAFIFLPKYSNRLIFGKRAYFVLLFLDHEQSLFSLGPSSKTPQTRKWPRAWLKARDGRRTRHRFSLLAASPLNARSRARALPLLNLKEKTDCSQSILFPNMPANPIISQICIFVTSPFSSSQFLPLKMETLLHCGHYSLSQGCQAYRIPFSIIWTLLYCGRFFWSQQC